MITKFSLRHAAVLATLVIGGVVAADLAQAASAGQRRTVSTAGMTQYNLGNGVMVYTNNPAVVVRSLRWSTGASSGSATNIGGAQ